MNSKGAEFLCAVRTTAGVPDGEGINGGYNRHTKGTITWRFVPRSHPAVDADEKLWNAQSGQAMNGLWKCYMCLQYKPHNPCDQCDPLFELSCGCFHALHSAGMCSKCRRLYCDNHWESHKRECENK